MPRCPLSRGAAEKRSSSKESLPWKERGPAGAKRGAHYVFISDCVSGLENVPQRKETMKGLKFQTPLGALRQGLRTKPRLSAHYPHSLSLLEPPEGPGLAPNGDVGNKISGSFFTWTDKNTTLRPGCLPTSALTGRCGDHGRETPRVLRRDHWLGTRKPKFKAWLCYSLASESLWTI